MSSVPSHCASSVNSESDHLFALTGHTVLVTGASRGIGRACAEMAAESGARVVLTSRQFEDLNAVCESLSGEGHCVFPRDLSQDIDSISDWLKNEVVPVSGKLSGIVHAAGMAQTIPIRALRSGMTTKLFDTNMHAALALARGMRNPRVHAATASLVLVSSTLAFRGRVGLSSYAASKAALVGMGRTLAIELAPDGIRVNCVLPGWVDTAMTAEDAGIAHSGEDTMENIRSRHLLGFGDPKDVSGAVVFLLSSLSSWITGTEIVVDGGFSAT